MTMHLKLFAGALACLLSAPISISLSAMNRPATEARRPGMDHPRRLKRSPAHAVRGASRHKPRSLHGVEPVQV